jgi:glycosyltransferase involved in cell wall biosynthesis
MKLAVFTVAYSQAEPYFEDYFASVRAQTDREFDLLILNDGISPERLSASAAGLRCNLCVREASANPVGLRKLGIEWLQSGHYDAVVFADIDDRFPPNRISVSRQLLMQCDLLANELLLFGASLSQPKTMLNGRVSEQNPITKLDLRNYNFMGMSNTAARVKSILEAARAIRAPVVAFDWALYTRALINGASARFTRATETEYRQHSANIAGIDNSSDEQILRGVNIKTDHYMQLAEQGEWYAKQAHAYSELRTSLQSDFQRRQNYFSSIRAHWPAQPLWWESIRLEEDIQ